MSRYIHRCGGTVGVAEDGKAGLDKARSGHYDLAFVDIQLPKMDGFMVATLLREQGYRLPLIGMSSLCMESMAAKARAVGFDEFWCKPIVEHTVMRLLAQYGVRSEPETKPNSHCC